MPLSFEHFGASAILVMIGILSLNELIKYLRSPGQDAHKP